jgi:hypothetical protein
MLLLQFKNQSCSCRVIFVLQERNHLIRGHLTRGIPEIRDASTTEQQVAETLEEDDRDI